MGAATVDFEAQDRQETGRRRRGERTRITLLHRMSLVMALIDRSLRCSESVRLYGYLHRPGLEAGMRVHDPTETSAAQHFRSAKALFVP